MYKFSYFIYQTNSAMDIIQYIYNNNIKKSISLKFKSNKNKY